MKVDFDFPRLFVENNLEPLELLGTTGKLSRKNYLTWNRSWNLLEPFFFDRFLTSLYYYYYYYYYFYYLKKIIIIIIIIIMK